MKALANNFKKAYDLFSNKNNETNESHFKNMNKGNESSIKNKIKGKVKMMMALNLTRHMSKFFFN